MTADERRASISLAALYALRMFGLFLILPVFAEHARHLPSGKDATLIGLSLGAYGLTQALLQIPFGAASDRLGRKPIIVTGLIVLAIGSVVAALATDLPMLAVGRALQGAGAISAALTALLADLTRDTQRTKAMAMIGASIGASFALALVLAPIGYQQIGMAGLFFALAALACAAIALVWLAVPSAAPQRALAAAGAAAERPWKQVLGDADLLRLNCGILILHAIQMAMFIVVPGWLIERGQLPLPSHWQIYLPVLLLSFALMMGPLNAAERGGWLKQLFCASILGLAVVQILLAFGPSGLVHLGVLLFLFFMAFNLLEALLPSLVSRLAPAQARGLAMGVFNTAQSLGLFIGGLAGGWLVQHAGAAVMFAAAAVACLVWVMLALTLNWQRVRPR